MDIETQLREILLPVFGLDTIDRVKPEYSFIRDLAADSLDFVEILHLVEMNFGVVITQDEVMIGGKNINTDGLFEDGKLTPGGEALLKENFPERKEELKTGMTKVELFSLLTVGDLANIIIREKEK
jgi:acyl carrier protein